MSEYRNKNTFIRDIERCPYVPREPEFAIWSERDIERINKLSDHRTELANKASSYFNHPDKTVREMAKFIDWLLEK